MKNNKVAVNKSCCSVTNYVTAQQHNGEMQFQAQTRTHFNIYPYIHLECRQT